MLPLPAAFSGAPSAEMMTTLKPVRWCVLGLWVCWVTRTLLQGPFASLSVLIAAITGTFFLHTDEKVSGCYGLLARTPLMNCGPGGMQCAAPFMMMGLLNALFDLITFFGLLSSFNDPYTALLGISIGLSVILQAVAVWVTYKAVKPLFGAPDSPGLQVSVPSQYVSLDTRPTQPLFTGQAHRLNNQ